MPSEGDGILLLQGYVQRYSWGRCGQRSRVARYAVAQKALPAEQVSETGPYAELWLGSHPSGEASILTEHQGWVPLSDYLPAGTLPFLLKVLSVGRALSIQAHPDSALARTLHAQYPQVYKDANHKPEMCVCLGPEPFEALFGFRPVEQIVDALYRVPEFRLACGEFVDEFCASPGAPDALRNLFQSFMHNEQVSTAQAERLQARLEAADELDPNSALALRLAKQYPKDAGVFAAFLLNHLKLEPGEAIFVGPNEPHAYLEGDCIEIMATSDNVVRAGLTDKHKDIETLCSMLTYVSKDPVEIIRRDHRNRFAAPAKEFQLEYLELSGEPLSQLTTTTTTLEPSNGYSILLAVDGEVSIFRKNGHHSHHLFPGMACLIAPGLAATLRPLTSNCSLFRASAPAPEPMNGFSVNELGAGDECSN
jgi:mannose-6-phosphate isomerase